MGFGNMAGEINKITQGANLATPKFTLTWIIGAVFAVMLMMGVIAIATWGFAKAKLTGKKAIGQTTNLGSGLLEDSQADGDGWY